MSNQMFGVPHDRLTNQQQLVDVVSQMNSFLKDAGIRYIKTKQDTTALKGDMKKLEGVAPMTTGLANISLTDGTDAADSTISVIDDRVDGSFLDDQLTGFVSRDPEILLYPDASGGKESFNRGQSLQTNQIIGSNLTTQLGPNGRPLVEIQYNDKSGKDGVQGIGYYEVPEPDLATLAQSTYGIRYQLKNYANSSTIGTAADGIFNVIDYKVNQWNLSGSQEPVTSETGLVIRRLSDGYGLYDADGNPKMKQGAHIKFAGERAYDDLRNYLGVALINQ